MSEQRWLSIEGICSTLQISRSHAIWLANQGHLAVIWGKPKLKLKDARFLDPTPEYAAKLKRCEAFYGRICPIPIDLDMVPLLSLREVSEVLGITLKSARNLDRRGGISGRLKVGSYHLYPSSSIRELLWRRQGRKKNKQQDPFLIEDLIRWFLERQADQAKGIPTDTQMLADERMERRLAAIVKLPSPDRDRAMTALWRKVEMAKQVAEAVSSS